MDEQVLSHNFDRFLPSFAMNLAAPCTAHANIFVFVVECALEPNWIGK